jgi:hypothetical protein
MSYILRDVTLSTLSASSSAKFLRAVASSGASIVSSFSLGTGYTLEQCADVSMFFRLRFITQSRLDKFESYGFKTQPIESVNLK